MDFLKYLAVAIIVNYLALLHTVWRRTRREQCDRPISATEAMAAINRASRRDVGRSTIHDFS